MAAKKKAKTLKMPSVLDPDAVKERQKELRALAKTGGPATEEGLPTEGNCRWIPEDIIVIGPNGIPRRETRWRRVCT